MLHVDLVVNMLFNSKAVLSLLIGNAGHQPVLQSVPSGYPNPTRYPVFLSIPDPT